jgi:hypothetical protein
LTVNARERPLDAGQVLHDSGGVLFGHDSFGSALTLNRYVFTL